MQNFMKIAMQNFMKIAMQNFMKIRQNDFNADTTAHTDRRTWSTQQTFFLLCKDGQYIRLQRLGGATQNVHQRGHMSIHNQHTGLLNTYWCWRSGNFLPQDTSKKLAWTPIQKANGTLQNTTNHYATNIRQPASGLHYKR